MKKKALSRGFKAVADGKQAHEKIADQLKRAIFEKKIGPGEKLPTERDLARIFNTSRVTVRAAILTLRKAGLVHVRKGITGGSFVADHLNEGDISEILRDIIQWKDISLLHVVEVRSIIEPQIAYLAARHATPEDIQTIWGTINELEQLFRVKTEFKSNDENFHKALAAAAGNPLLRVFQASLIDVLFKFIYRIVWQEEHKKRILLYHSRIAKKVEEHDPDGARQAMVEHLADMHKILSDVPVTKVLKWIKE